MGNIGLGASRSRRRILSARLEQLYDKESVKQGAVIPDPNKWVKWRTQKYTALLKQYNAGGYGDVGSTRAVEGFYEAIGMIEAWIVGTTTSLPRIESLKPGDRTWSFAAER